MERPSGVSSDREASWLFRPGSGRVVRYVGINSEAMRLPSVMVPVLSSSNTSMSPAASTDRPLFGNHVVPHQAVDSGDAHGTEEPADGGGMRHTRSATSTGTVMMALKILSRRLAAVVGEEFQVATARRNTMVRPESRMLKAISLGVF